MYRSSIVNLRQHQYHYLHSLLLADFDSSRERTHSNSCDSITKIHSFNVGILLGVFDLVFGI